MPRVTYISQWYRSRNRARNQEINQCAKANSECNALDRLIWYVPKQDVAAIPKWLRGTITPIPDRLHYTHAFQTSQQDKDDTMIYILANTDMIIISETIELIKSHLTRQQVYCLTRWEGIGEGARFKAVAGSQDVWCWKGPVVIPRARGIALGKPGCDNRIAAEFKRVGKQVLNPSRTLKTYHVHASQYRTQSAKDTVPQPYLAITCTVLRA